ncbi:glycosyltransferase [Enterococcus sp. AZ072]|uniref:glycosyltransferase n=1 Tax=unclassified Enterococcus TaxID=2608891 RepID=UPI003D2E84F8
MTVSIIIPAYEPESRFLTFLTTLLCQTDRPIIVIDDGSGAAYQAVFQEAKRKGAILLNHSQNLGKGAALKTAMRFQLLHLPEIEGLVTTDSDGQHRVNDILKIASLVEKNQDTLFLGTRQFDQDQIPFKSRFGNKLTALMFRFSTGIPLSDTQTGLRGIPQSHLEQMLEIPGKRFDYEMNMLIQAKDINLSLEEVPIETVYFGNNEHSHFRSVIDSMLVYMPFFKFIASSVLSAVVDILFFVILLKLVFPRASNALFAATAIARISSGFLNYQLNRHLVFKTDHKQISEAAKYALLFMSQLLLSSLLVQGLAEIFQHIVLIKVVVDCGIFILSFYIQRRFVFKRGGIES